MNYRLVTLDIETSPNLAHVWGLWDQNVGLNQLLDSGQVICFAAKWYGKPRVEFYSDHHDGHEDMVAQAHRILDEADAVCHFNGARFDIPWLQREFVEAGLTPPSPFKQVDLLKTVKRQFRFPSNKLQYVSTKLGLPGKVQHSGHDLWVKCLAGDDKAWSLMRKYNKQDVVLTEALYDRLHPWITGLPNLSLFVDEGADSLSCPACGGSQVQRRGTATTQLGRYPRFQCQSPECGRWLRGKRAEFMADLREAK